VPRQAHTAQDIRFKKTQPVRVRDLLEGLGLEGAHVVHEDVHIRQPAHQFITTGSSAQVGGDAVEKADVLGA
jgi:hypothetical protein